jgi:hypothetical protein
MDDDKNNESVKAILDSITKSIGIGTAITLAISINYELWYYKYFGISLTQVPASFQDHIKSSLNFLPIILGAVVGANAVKLLIKRFPSFKPRTNKDKLHKAISANKSYPMPFSLKIITILSCIALIVDASLWSSLQFFHRIAIIEMSLYFIGNSIIWWFFAHPFFSGYNNNIVFMAYCSLFVVFVFVPTGAYFRASTDIRHGKGFYIYTTDDIRRKQEVKILRTYDKYIFIAYTSSSVTMIPQASVLKIEKNFTPKQ